MLVLVEGNPIPSTLAISHIRVTHAAGKLASAQIELMSTAAEAGAVPDADGLVFVPGKTVEIRMGYDAQVERVFAGVVVARRTTIRMSGSALVVQCRHPLYRSTLAPRSRTWSDTTDAECIATLCAEHGVHAQVAPGGVRHRLLVQSRQTDWDFLCVRAVASGLLLQAGSDGLQAQPPKLAEAPVLELQVSINILELALETDLRWQPAGVEVHAWAAADQSLMRVVADEPALPGYDQQRGVALAAIHGQSRDIDAGAADEPAMQSFASGQLLGARLGARAGQISMQGVAHLSPGQWVTLSGAGAMLDGELFVTRVEHRVESGDWKTEIEVGNPFPLLQDAALPATTPAMQLQPGVVHALENDPEGEGRIQVRLPMLGENASPLWARLLCFDAGQDRGASFAPEIGDEVLLGFPGDASQPVVLGALHSSAYPNPLGLSDGNHQKGYFSRSGLQLVFDDARKSIALSTSAGNQLLLSEDEEGIRLQDSHGNRIVMDATGIRIESAADLLLQATKDTLVEAGNLRLKAHVQLEAEGGAGAAVKSAGVVTVRGGIVQIN